MAENSPTPAPLHYRSIKAILAHMSVEKREKMQREIPSLRSLNATVPYTFDLVHLTSKGLRQTNKKLWDVEPQVVSQVIRWDTHHGRRRKHVTSTYDDGEEEYARLALKYIQDGTRIRQLQFEGFPRCLAEKNPDTFKIHVSELVLDRYAMRMATEQFRTLVSFLDDSVPLKRVEMPISAECLPMLGLPLINSCTELSLCRLVDYGRNHILFEDLLRHSDMNHTHLDVTFAFFFEGHTRGIDFAKDLAQHWINIKKFIGSTFTVPCLEYSFISDVFDELKSRFNARKATIKELGSDFFAHCVIIPLTEASEIVAYGIRYTKKYDGSSFDFALKMEVRRVGSTDAPKFFD